MEFSRQEYWSGSPFPTPGDLPDPGIKLGSHVSPASAGRLFTTSATWETPRNSRKPMRLPPRHEMRPDSPALHAEQLRFPNQTHKEPRFA